MIPSPQPLLTLPQRMAVFFGLVCVRLMWAGGIGPSDGELLAWTAGAFSAPFPASFGTMALVAPGVALFGDHPSALRLGFAILAAAPVLLVGPRKLSVALAATLPILTVPGGLVTPAAPLAAIWLGSWQLARHRPLGSGLLAGLGCAFHPVGTWVALPALVRAPNRAPLLIGAVLAALPFLPGSFWSTTLPLQGELSPTGLGLAAMLLAGPLLLPGVVSQLRQPGSPRNAALGCLSGIGLIVVTGAPAPLLAGPLALGILAVSPADHRPYR